MTVVLLLQLVLFGRTERSRRLISLVLKTRSLESREENNDFGISKTTLLNRYENLISSSTNELYGHSFLRFLFVSRLSRSTSTSIRDYVSITPCREHSETKQKNKIVLKKKKRDVRRPSIVVNFNIIIRHWTCFNLKFTESVL